MNDRVPRVVLAGALVAAMALAGCPSSKHAISGTVSGAIADGVLVTLAPPGPSASTTTSGGGRYDFSGLAPGTYTVTPSLAGYTFAPASLAITVQGSDVSGADFAAVALPGTLDASFGDGGATRSAFASSTYATAMAIAPDGKLVVAGHMSRPLDSSPALARYDDAGVLDRSFGDAGRVTASIGPSGSVSAVAVQPDGKIVAAGGSPDPADGAGGRFALARFALDGALDPGFGAGGTLATAFPQGRATARGVAIQPDGKIVAAGISNGEIALARYVSDGTLDPSFGAQGLVTTSLAPGGAGAFAVALQPDRKIVVAGGGSAADGSSAFVLARYEEDGALDAGFGEGGVVLTRFAEIDSAYALAIQPDDKIVVAGYTATPGPGVTDHVLAFALARYLPDGTLDPAFGTGGKVTTAFAGMQDIARALAIQADGKVVAAGSTYAVETGTLFALARYLSDGTLDPTFGTGGRQTVAIRTLPPPAGVSTFDCEAVGLAIQPDGKLVAGGSAQAAFGVARFWP